MNNIVEMKDFESKKNKVELIFDNLDTNEGQEKATANLVRLQNGLRKSIENDIDFKITIEEIKK